MFITKNHPVFLTLFLLIVTVFVLTPAVSATSYASGGVSRRREHATLKRFIKKRAGIPAPSSTPSSDSNLAGLPLIGAAPDPTDIAPVNTTTTTSTSLTSTSTTDTATISSSTNTSSVTTESATTTSGNTTSTTTSSSSSSSTSSSTTSQTSQTSATDSAVQTSVTPSSTQVTLTETRTAAAAVETNAAPSQGSGGLSGGKTALVTVLIVVAASVGGFAILWTVFRKWKLGRSKKFDQRLQPISWEPTADDDIVPHRPGSDSASFRSTQDNRSGYGATSNLSHGLDHDFTAGPAHLAPVGGYADLTRGPSPQPSMQEQLSRGPSLTRPNYDASVPLHHQNNYGVQDTYGRY